jgi:hypothetical protein
MFRVYQERLSEPWGLLTVRRTTAARRVHMVISADNSATSRRAFRRAVLCAFGVGMLAASCSSSSEDAVTTTEARSITAPATSEQVVPTTTEATTSTEAPSTTAAATSATVDPAAAADAEIREAIALAQISFSDCLVALPVCDPATLEVARAGDLLARNTSLINEWNSLGYTVRDRDQFRYVVESVVVDSSLATAVATVCIADGSRLVLPNAAPDGGDVVIDDEYTSGRSEWEMRLDVDGVWRLYGSTPIGVAATEDVCGAA